MKILFASSILLVNTCIAYAQSDQAALKVISDEVVKGSSNFEDKIRALRQYVYEKIAIPRKKNPSLDPNLVWPLNTLERLNSGLGGYCDQQADVFMDLAKTLGITTRQVYLFCKGQRGSCHTIAEAFDGNRRIIVDTMFNLELKNENGQMASREDVTSDLGIILRTPNVQELIKENRQRWESNEEWLKIYSYRNPFYIAKVLKGDNL